MELRSIFGTVLKIYSASYKKIFEEYLKIKY